MAVGRCDVGDHGALIPVLIDRFHTQNDFIYMGEGVTASVVEKADEVGLLGRREAA